MDNPSPTGKHYLETGWHDELHNLITRIVYALVDFPDKVRVEALPGEAGTRFLVFADPTDRGKVIGKQGRTAKAMRTLLGAISVKLGHQYTLQIEEGEDVDLPSRGE